MINTIKKKYVFIFLLIFIITMLVISNVYATSMVSLVPQNNVPLVIIRIDESDEKQYKQQMRKT